MYEPTINKEFVKGYHLPIHIYREPYFSYLLDLYEDTFDSLYKYYNVFIPSLLLFNNPEEFFEEKNRILNDMVEFFNKRNPQAADELRHLDMHNLLEEFPKVPKIKKLYSEATDNQLFISIDFKKACHSVLHYFNIIPDVNYEDFISRFTDVPYFKESRQLRQMAFGHFTPKKQITVQTYFINYICHLLYNNNFPENYLSKDFIVYNNGGDELLICLDEEDIKERKFMNDIIDYLDTMLNYNGIKYRIPFKFDIDIIKIKRVNKECYIREVVNKGTKHLKATPAHLYPQYHKKYILGKKIEDYDLYFECDKYISKFVETIEDKEEKSDLS